MCRYTPSMYVCIHVCMCMITCPTSLEKKEIHLIKTMGLTYFCPPGEGGTTVSFSTTDSSKLDLEKLQMMVTQDKEPETAFM